MEEGVKVWTKGGPELWRKGVVSKRVPEATGSSAIARITVVLEEGGTVEYAVAADEEEECADVKLRNVAGQASNLEGAGVEDLTSLSHLHEPTILYSLSQRYDSDLIYTGVGPILLAVNPFKRVDLYSDDILAAYRKDGERRHYDPDYHETMAPHVYAIADKAYRNMTAPSNEYEHRSQSILVSGESGAGKTETCKIIMKYLAILGSKTGSTELGTIEQQVLESNPILEAFGNARTVRNDNSSRFGKYIQIIFDSYGKLTGAQIKTFLLEKVRVVKHSAMERNYHIFYMLAAGASAEQRESWAMGDLMTHQFTSQSGCYDRRDGVLDSDLYKELMEAFQVMGFEEDEKANVFRMVAAVLALGDVDFVERPDAGDTEALTALSEPSRPRLEAAARLLDVSADRILSSLTSRKINAGISNQVTIFLTMEQSRHARDALAKAVYAAMFEWVVGRTNECIEAKQAEVMKEDRIFIGLLDIFGFEIFTSNYFEQFLINYANEVLQQQFNNFVFRQEQEEYEREKIQWTFIEFPDNKDCIELIDRKPNGIIPTLDEQCLLGRSTDDRFAREMYKKCEGHDRFELAPKMRVDHQFCVRHYAGKVVYSTEGIIDKNRDTLQQEGVDMLLSSGSDFTVLMGEIEAKSTKVKGKPRRSEGASAGPGAGVGGSGGGSGGSRRVGRRTTIGAKSLGAQFRENLNNLVATVDKTHPHYVRTIKPNDYLKPGNFAYDRIAEQLRNAGVLEVVRVARAGFPVRLGIQEFIDRYGVLAPLVVEAAYRNCAQDGGEIDQESERAVCKALVVSIVAKVTKEKANATTEEQFMALCRDVGMQMGLTKVFFQQKAFNSIERLRTAMIANSITKLQTAVRCWSVRKKFVKDRKAAVTVQAWVRGEQARATVGREMQELVRKRKDKEALEAEEARLVAEEKQKQLEEQALSVRLAQLRVEMQEEIDSVKAELTKAKATVKDLQGLTGRKVAVTGALRGCGPAIVKRLLQEGAFVVAADRGMSDEQAEAAGLRPPAGGAAAANTPEADAFGPGRLVFFDMGGPGEEAGACGLSSLCVESFGGMDGLVCNTSARSMLVGEGAAVANGGGADSNNMLENLEPTDWADALTGALTEPMLAVKHALPLMQAACANGKVASGAIVNVVCTSSSSSSTAGASGSGGAGAEAEWAPGSSAEALSNRETLAAAAGGLAGLTHALAVSSGPRVRVNAVSVPEGSGRSAAGSSGAARAGRVGSDAASAVSFLLSSRAGSVTGQNLVVDDGPALKF
ncbi:unnamed protein product [Pylaiella littoralis]